MDLDGNSILELPIFREQSSLDENCLPKRLHIKSHFTFHYIIYNLIFQNLVVSTSVHAGLTVASILHFSNIPHTSSAPYEHKLICNFRLWTSFNHRDKTGTTTLSATRTTGHPSCWTESFCRTTGSSSTSCHGSQSASC